MNEEERRQIEEQIRILTRIENLEKALVSISDNVKWARNAVWGATLYLAFKLSELLVNGGLDIVLNGGASK